MWSEIIQEQQTRMQLHVNPINYNVILTGNLTRLVDLIVLYTHIFGLARFTFLIASHIGSLCSFPVTI